MKYSKTKIVVLCGGKGKRLGKSQKNSKTTSKSRKKIHNGTQAKLLF